MPKSILLVSYFAPSRAHAGGLRLLDLYRQIRLLNRNIRLELVACRHPEADWGAQFADEIFNDVHWLAQDEYCFAAIEKLGLFERHFDVIDLQYHQSGAFISAFKHKCPDSTILFSPMESLIRAACLQSHIDWRQLRLKGLCGQVWTALQELRYVRQADKVVCVSETDSATIRRVRRDGAVYCLPTGLSPYEFSASLARSGHERDDAVLGKKSLLVFLAYWASRTNREALIWFVKFVHPLIKASVPEYELNVVGHGADDELVNCCQISGVNFIGQVSSVECELAPAMGGIAPALSGAGIRGKVNQYAAVALPCVATSIAAAGLKYEPGRSILLADTPGGFAGHCISLLLDSDLRTRIGHEAKRICHESYTWSSMISDIANIYELND